MTPQWIADNAVITGPYDVQPRYFEISSSTGSTHQIVLQIQLVPPGILKVNDNVSIAIIMAMDTTLGESSDHDTRLGVSDDKNFIGFVTFDTSNYGRLSPCFHAEADKGNGVLINFRETNGPLVSANQYSGEMKMQFRPAEQWGSCQTEHEEGYTNIVNYKHFLDLTNGLYLEMYRHDADETYRIKYITASVELD